MSTENVEGFEVEWDDSYIYLRFIDAFGNGEQYSFTPGEAARIRALIDKALERWVQDEQIIPLPDRLFGTNLPPFPEENNGSERT